MKPITNLFLLFFFMVASVGASAHPDVTQTGQIVYLPLITRPGNPVDEIVNNGSFESGRDGWIEFEDSPFFDIPLIVQQKELPSAIKTYDGTWAAWLGGESDLTSYIQQQVMITGSGYELHYWYWIASNSTCDASYARVMINGAAVREYSLCAAAQTGGWINDIIDLNSYSGQTISLQFFSKNDQDNFSSFYIDAVSIR
jgi:hypothetical protein